MDPAIKSVLRNLPENRRETNSFKGILFFSLCLLAWVGSWLTIVLAPLWLAVIGCIGHGLSIAMLFIVGHDACHGSLVKSRRWNRILGTLAFLPGYHPCTSWKRVHNSMHHSWTNLQGEDPGHAPFSYEQFQRLPLHRRLLERFYRTRLSFGLGTFYFIETWWKHLMFPNRSERPANLREFQIDRLLILSMVIIQYSLIYLVSVAVGREFPALFAAFAIILFSYVFFHMMGFVTFQHHTHPQIPWFNQREDWSYFQSQVSGTAHLQFPRIFDFFLLNIFEHSAHHADPLIPLHRLQQSQAALETVYPNTITIIPWNPGVLWDTLRLCKLYDYQTHQWLNYNGTPTTDPQLVFPRESMVSRGDIAQVKNAVESEKATI